MSNCCSPNTTVFTGGPIKIEGTPPPGEPGAAQVILPFAAIPYPTVNTDTKHRVLQPILEAAVRTASNRLGSQTQKIAFSLLALARDGNHIYAGVNDDTMHYSASLLKVSAMYAAHELLASANRLAQKPPFPQNALAFFKSLINTFDPLIKAAARPEVIKASKDLAKKLPAFNSTPTYDTIFAVTGFGGGSSPTVTFTPEFLGKMTNMIVNSDDPDAGECIRRLSYSYINAASIKAGFYKPSLTQGIWLAGDYSNNANPYAFIRSDNDGQSAFVTTTRQIARLFALIQLKKLVHDQGTGFALGSSSMKMQDLLKNALKSWLILDWTRTNLEIRLFNVTQVKIGVGPLKSKQSVYSEGFIAKWGMGEEEEERKLRNHNLTGEFVVCWQNLRAAEISTHFNGVADVIETTFSRFLDLPI